MSDLRPALVAIKDIAKLFAPLATVGESVDALAAVLDHEAELKASIQSLLGRQAQIEAECQQRVADCNAEIAAKCKVHNDAVAGYEAKLDTLDRELKDAKAGRQARIDAETQAGDRIVGQIRTALKAEKERVAAEQARIAAEHDAFIEKTKAHRAEIEENTAALQAKLDALRDQARVALDSYVSMKE